MATVKITTSGSVYFDTVSKDLNTKTDVIKHGKRQSFIYISIELEDQAARLMDIGEIDCMVDSFKEELEKKIESTIKDDPNYKMRIV